MQLKGDLMQAAIAFAYAKSDAEVEATRRTILDLVSQTPDRCGISHVPPDSTVKRVLSGGSAPIDHLTDDQLAALNALLPWGGMTADSAGRVVGAPWSSSKRNVQLPLIDSRLSAFTDRFPIEGKTALEVGCFEGIHTIGILTLGGRVTAIDSRMENILKTLARLWAYGLQTEVKVWDLENDTPPTNVPESWDFLHHVGVLYHQTNPAESLAMLLDRTREAVLLDTHVALGVDTANKVYESLGREFRYEQKGEKPISPFAGMKDHAKWLLATDLEAICVFKGFKVERCDVRQERNGARALIWAFR